jgi:putative glutathione S-transferase
VTVPVLWDREKRTIVSNESGEIIRFLNTAFDALGADASVDLYPAPLRDEIDDVNARVYETVNNGVYRCGFARRQEAYDEAVDELFETLDWLEERLSRQRWLVGDQLTEADVRLFVTSVRFDPVYVTHFKCNRKRLADYPNLLGHTRDVFQTDGVAETVNLAHIKDHYYGSHKQLNPYGIVPVGFEVDLSVPHGRG